MDIIQFEKMYPTPSHAAEAERFERLPEADRARFKYLMHSRRRSVDALASATKWIDQDYLQETIDMIDRMLGALERSTSISGRAVYTIYLCSEYAPIAGPRGTQPVGARGCYEPAAKAAACFIMRQAKATT